MRILLTFIMTLTLSLSVGHTQITCDPGKIISNGVCEDCPAGKVPSADQSTCLSCAVGTFQPLSGAIVCQPCAIGFYSGQEGAEACTSCPDGYTTIAHGASSINMCIPTIPIIPTMSQWALFVLGLLLATTATLLVRSRVKVGR